MEIHWSFFLCLPSGLNSNTKVFELSLSCSLTGSFLCKELFSKFKPSETAAFSDSNGRLFWEKEPASTECLWLTGAYSSAPSAVQLLLTIFLPLNSFRNFAAKGRRPSPRDVIQTCTGLHFLPIIQVACMCLKTGRSHVSCTLHPHASW